MQRFFATRKGGNMRSVALSLAFSTLFIAVSVGAATTISTDITTGGNLTVTGTTGLTGLTTMVYASSTGQSLSSNLTVTGTTGLTGLTTMVYASSTGQSLTRNLLVNGMATTTGSSGNLEIQGGLTVGNATTNSLAGTILLSAQSSDPTGVTQGTIYYNSTSKVLRLFDGTNWFTTGTTSSGFLLNNNQIQLDNLAIRNLTLGTTTQQSAGQALVTLEGTTTTSVPLALVGFTGQTGHILYILNGSVISAPKLLYISSSGGLFASSTGAFGGTLTVGGALTATSTVGVATTSPTATFSVLGNSYVSGTGFFGGTLTATSTALLAATGGTVGVGATSTPAALFSVQGNSYVSGTGYFGGAVTATSTLSVASTFSVNGNATTSSTGIISTLGTLNVGPLVATTTTTGGNITASSTATTTLMLYSSSATQGSCITFKAPDGTYLSLIATTTGPAQFITGGCFK